MIKTIMTKIKDAEKMLKLGKVSNVPIRSDRSIRWMIWIERIEAMKVKRNETIIEFYHRLLIWLETLWFGIDLDPIGGPDCRCAMCWSINAVIHSGFIPLGSIIIIITRGENSEFYVALGFCRIITFGIYFFILFFSDFTLFLSVSTNIRFHFD